MITPEQQKLQLQSEIQLLTKKRHDLLLDIERVQKSRNEAIKQQQANEKEQQRVKANLVELHKEYEQTTSASQQVSKMAENYSKEHIEKAIITLNETQTVIDKQRKDIEAKLKLNERTLIVIQEKEQELKRLESRYVIGLQENEGLICQNTSILQITREKLTEVEKKEQEIDGMYGKAKHYYNEAVVVLTQAKEKEYAILKDIKEKEEDLTNKLLLYAIKDRQVQIDKDTLEKRSKLLDDKEKWLEDREQTVARAYKEVINRGGIINGK